MYTHGCTPAKRPEPSFPTTNPAFSVPQVDRWKTCTAMSGRSMTHPLGPIFFKDKHLQRRPNLAKRSLSRSVISVMHVYDSYLCPTTAIPVTIFLLLRYLQASSFSLSELVLDIRDTFDCLRPRHLQTRFFLSFLFSNSFRLGSR